MIRGREYHHYRVCYIGKSLLSSHRLLQPLQFYGGGDSPHVYYLSVLATGKRETETALLAVNRRHDELCGVEFSDPEDMDDDKVAAILGWDSASPPSNIIAAADDLADQFNEERERERTRLTTQFFAFRQAALLHGEDTREAFTDYMERLLVFAILERSGMRTLLPAGAGGDGVDDFLAQDIVTLDELKQIYVGVYLMSPQQVFRAICDAFRPINDSHEVILGRRIYSSESTAPIPLAAWDLFEDVMPCRHCALQGCARLDEWARVERLATLALRFVSWQPEGLAGFSRADTLFHLSGVFAERKWERYSPKPYRAPPKKSGPWVEVERPAGLYLKVCMLNFSLVRVGVW